MEAVHHVAVALEVVRETVAIVVIPVALQFV